MIVASLVVDTHMKTPSEIASELFGVSYRWSGALNVWGHSALSVPELTRTYRQIYTRRLWQA